MDLKDLEVYQLARELSHDGWDIYQELDAEIKRIFGYQFIEAVDSVGANIAEGFGRFHFLDKNKFNYNARGSLIESDHWVDLLIERKKVDVARGKDFKTKLQRLSVKLNNYITSTRNQIRKPT